MKKSNKILLKYLVLLILIGFGWKVFGLAAAVGVAIVMAVASFANTEIINARIDSILKMLVEKKIISNREREAELSNKRLEIIYNHDWAKPRKELDEKLRKMDEELENEDN